MYIIFEGAASVHLHYGGKSVATLQKDMVFGDQALFGGQGKR
jgi:hypothetical protein